MKTPPHFAHSASPVSREGTGVAAARAPQPSVSRRAKPVLDLPQLELDCMKVLWVRGEASVRQIWTELSARRSLAYTTIETILDRLARKGVVTRVRNGRAFLYRPHFTVEQARHFALTKLVENFFGGSVRQLAAFLENPDALAVSPNSPAPLPVHPDTGRVQPDAGRAAQRTRASRRPAPTKSGRARRREVTRAPASAIDESLL